MQCSVLPPCFPRCLGGGSSVPPFSATADTCRDGSPARLSPQSFSKAWEMLKLNFSHWPHSRDGGNHLPLAWLELKQSKPPPGPAEPTSFPPIPTINSSSFGDFPPGCDGITAPYFMIIHFSFCHLSLSCSRWHLHLGIPKKPQESWNILSSRGPTGMVESNSWLLRALQESHPVPGNIG